MTFPTLFVLAAVAPAAGGGLSDILANPIWFIGIMVVMMYFLLFRPQQQQMKRHREMVGAVKRGDTVILSSGVIGKVVRVEETEVGVEIAQNVTVKVLKDRIADVRARGEPAPANDAKSAKTAAR